eukprot:11477584-Ditylum_brightwellii.AAC.1
MDNFFATKKAVPLKSKVEVLLAVKQFAKEVDAPDSFICNAAAERTSQPLRSFCAEIGTTLRVLEEGTLWANKVEIYIGLLKEAVQNDMKEPKCPLALWDY